MSSDAISSPTRTLPLPPYALRQLVGPTNPSAFDNPHGQLLFPDIPPQLYESVFDFGCGCGRQARQLILQQPRPQRYVGIDVHDEMITWCQRNLTPAAPEFSFYHHDVYNPLLNPTSVHHTLPFPVEHGDFMLVIACSVFTHLVESQLLFYLKEVARILRPEGLFFSTWFLFDKRRFPMMQSHQNALYINTQDPTNAVIYDRHWLEDMSRQAGLAITKIIEPAIRGFQWYIYFSLRRPNQPTVAWPEDDAPFGSVSPNEGIKFG